MAHFLPFKPDTSSKLSLLVVSQSRRAGQLIVKTLRANSVSSAISQPYLKVHSCERICQLLEKEHCPHVDFIVFVAEPEHTFNLSEVAAAIMQLDKAYLLDRLCLIHKTPPQYQSLNELQNFKLKYQVHMLWGNVMEEGSCKELCKRLMNLVTAVSGVKSGIPLFTYSPSFGLTNISRSTHDYAVPEESWASDSADQSTS